MDAQLYTMETSDMQKNANIVKEALLGALEREGMLKESGEVIASRYAVVISKPGWLGSVFKRMSGTFEKNMLAVDVVKVV
jgi:hypothetical protein